MGQDITMAVSPEQAERIRRLLREDRDKLLSKLGVLIVSDAKTAFRDGGFDGTPWPQRYPNQTEGAFNIAGALSDLQGGITVKKRRYEAQPVGRDTGALSRSITYEVTGGTLEVGSKLPYAQRFHEGGESSISITPTLRRNLSAFLKKKRRGHKRKRNAARRAGETIDARSIEERYLGPVFAAGDQWTTTSPARPFVGMSKRTVEAFGEELNEFFRKAAR